MLSGSVKIAEPNRKKEDSSFPGNNSANEKPLFSKVFVYYSPPHFFFFSIRAFSFPYHVGTCTLLAMATDRKLQFSADPK